jgi:TPR repeat protein
MSAILIAILVSLPSLAFAGMTPEEVAAFQKVQKRNAAGGGGLNQYILGHYYAQGKGVVKDEVEAVKWFRKAADQGDELAQFHLGICYANGTGILKDEIESYAYFSIAGITLEEARSNQAILEKKLLPEARLRGQLRAKELQKEIEAKIAAKKADDAKKLGR